MFHRRGNYASAIEMNVEKLNIINSSLAAMLVSERIPLGVYSVCRGLAAFFPPSLSFLPFPTRYVALIVRRSMAKYRKIRG